MYTLIRLCDGSTVEAFVLAKTQSRMRLAVAGLNDAVELRHCAMDWLDESDEPVEFGFLLAKEEEDLEAPKVMRAAARYAC